LGPDRCRGPVTSIPTMALVPFCWPSEDLVICRRCARCGAVLQETARDGLECPRCGRVRAWTVTVDGKIVAAARATGRGGEIWPAGVLDDFRP
jgi:phage FluMu protein Com